MECLGLGKKIRTENQKSESELNRNETFKYPNGFYILIFEITEPESNRELNGYPNI